MGSQVGTAFVRLRLGDFVMVKVAVVVCLLVCYLDLMETKPMLSLQGTGVSNGKTRSDASATSGSKVQSISSISSGFNNPSSSDFNNQPSSGFNNQPSSRFNSFNNFNSFQRHRGCRRCG